MKKLLISGASGFLGWHVCRYAPKGWQFIGIYQDNKAGLFPKTENLKLDITDADQVWKALKDVRPDALYHLAANSSTSFCEKEPEKARALNVDASIKLAEMCADQKIRFIFTSSEQVYKGLKETYEETEDPTPGNTYGRQKLEAERRIIQIYPEAAIARIAVLYGYTKTSNRGFLMSWLDSWQKFMPVTVFNDEIRSFLSAASAAEALAMLLKQGAMGIFNVGGADSISRLEFAILVKEAFKLDITPMDIKSQQDIETGAYRPPRLNLNLNKICSIGFTPRFVEEELKRLASEITLPQPFSEN